MKFFKFTFGKSDKATAAIEFAILAPLLILTVFGLVEIGNYVFCFNKMNRVAQGVSNIVTRGDLTKPQLDSLLESSVLIAQPFNFSTNGCVLVTSISQTNVNTKTTPTVEWSDTYPAGSGSCSASKVNPASLPGGMVLATNSTIITTEVFYTYTPIFAGYTYNGSPLLTSAQLKIYALAVAVPRQGLMTTLPAS